MNCNKQGLSMPCLRFAALFCCQQLLKEGANIICFVHKMKLQHPMSFVSVFIQLKYISMIVGMDI